MSLQLGGNILVTGSNRGIGLELVRELAAKTGQEAHIYACCRDPDGTRAQALRELASLYPGKISVTKLDVSDEDSISSVVQTLTEQLKHTGLNLLINNAAIIVPAMPGSLSETTKKDMMDVYNTNVAGPFLLSKMLLPLLTKAAETHPPEKDSGEDIWTDGAAHIHNRKKERTEKNTGFVRGRCSAQKMCRRDRPPKEAALWKLGLVKTGLDHLCSSMSCRRSAIINVSTLAGSIEKCPENFHMAQIYPYRTSKAALNMLTRCQAVDFKASNVLVTAIHPGWVRTEMGGAQAPLNTQDSVQGMLTVMSSLSDKDSGILVSWEGERIPW